MDKQGVSSGRLKGAGDVMRIEGKELQKILIISFDGGREEVTQKLRQIDNLESNLRERGVRIWKKCGKEGLPMMVVAVAEAAVSSLSKNRCLFFKTQLFGDSVLVQGLICVEF